MDLTVVSAALTIEPGVGSGGGSGARAAAAA